MDNQTLLDLLVISMTAPEVIEQIGHNLNMFKDLGDTNHLDIAKMLVIALDNMYGENAYRDYKTTGKKFW